MTNPIVTVNVSQVVAPTPDNLQKKGAVLSQGGTTLSSSTSYFLSQASDLTSILAAPLAVTSIAWSGGTATVTTAAAHGVATSDVFLTTIAGATQSGYNGTFLATATGASTFTYALATNPGTTPATGTITYTPRGQAELLEQITSFFAQGGSQGVSVLELGAGEPAAGVSVLSTYITAQPKQPFYAYLVPRAWDSAASFLTLATTLNGTTAKTYFFVTTTTGTYTSYTALMKSVFWFIETPGVQTSQFQAAAPFYDLLNYDPSPTTKVTPFAWTELFGVTPYPLVGNGSLFSSLQNANGNIVGTGAEGGISNAILMWGTTADGKDFTYWYSVDWVQLNTDVTIANVIINGSNDKVNPLYLSQSGINRLQAALVAMLGSGVSYGLVFGNVTQTSYDQTTFNQKFDNGDFAGQAVVNAVPFASYYKLSPNDYQVGKYAGFTIVYTPNRGFKQIVVNVVVTQFAA